VDTAEYLKIQEYLRNDVLVIVLQSRSWICITYCTVGGAEARVVSRSNSGSDADANLNRIELKEEKNLLQYFCFLRYKFGFLFSRIKAGARYGWAGAT
jgi:hypothetical protein